MPTLVLGSTSVYRRELLARLGIPFTAAAPLCDEDSLKDSSLAPSALALHLARAKAASLAQRWPDAHILGCDQLVEIDGQVLGKPGTAESAVRQLSRLAGSSHRLVTAFALQHPDRSVTEHLEIHTLHMRSLSRAEIERYVAADQPLDCAGSYKIEARGIVLFDRIEGADFTAIVGLPIIALTTALRAQGFVVP